jgi:hypothetical protein|tara:strand:- start:3643 stop:4281 length:639 start_codon:yes stop_codon:yes gene_type:complete
MKANIIVAGRSGTGKSSSLRNLNPDTTVVLNVERKALPFKNAKKFKFNVPINTVNDFHTMLDKAMSNKDIENIVVESFTALYEMIYRESSVRFKGFDVWSNFNKEIDTILNKSKNSDKYVIFTAISDYVDDESGVTCEHVKVDGRRWRMAVEKEFVICLYTDIVQTDAGVKHTFITNTTGKNSAKSPMGMFEDLRIDNDLAQVLETCNEYYK